MPKPQNNQPLNSTKSIELLLEYQQVLEKEILELRAQACEKAAKVRLIKKSISDEQKQLVDDQQQADKSWSLNQNGVNLMSLVNGK